jgi:PAS domain S-box-containing protein
MVATQNHTEQQVHTAALRLQVKRRSDKLMNYFLVSYFLGGLLLASFYDTWTVAFEIGGLSLLAYYSAKIALPKSNLYQYVLSAVLGIFMAQYIYQMHGLFEMHFTAFIGSAILITYQNWKLQIPMALVVIIHHAIFGYLQDAGFDKVYFTQLDYFELRTFALHIFLAAVIFFVCGLWAYQLKKYSEIQIGQSMEMGRLQKEALVVFSEQKRQAELLKAQEELARSNDRFIYATKATSDAIWDRDNATDVIIWGDGFHTLFGYTINTGTGSMNFWASKVHPGDLPLVIDIIQRAKDNQAMNSWKCEYRFLKADGEYAFVRERAVILRDEYGKPVRMIGALQDITENKRNEIALKELNEDLEKEKYFLDALMNNMPDSIYFKDRESKLIRVSKYMADRFNLPVEELIGKSDFDFQDAIHASEAYMDEQSIMEKREPKTDYLETELMKDGSKLLVSTTKMPLLNPRDEVVGTFGISRDVTKVKKLEEERYNAELDKAVAQGKFEIASDVMHDIGNAMVGFGSYLTRIRRLQEQDDPEKLQNLARFFEEQKTVLMNAIGQAKADAVIKMLKGIAETQKSNQEETGKSVTEQLNIIAHIQEILHIQRQYITGHESQERKPVNLRNIIDDSLSMLSASAEKTGIDVSLQIAPDLPVIKGDRTKLMQAILNILKNSIEAIDSTSAERSILIEAGKETDRLVVQVKDSGKGFDPAMAIKLFEKGYTTKSSGTGLGLYNCRSIIESHEGTIDITSEGSGKGSLITIGFKL